MKTILAWLCRHGLHRRRVLEVLKGGAGPDDAAAYVECSWCGATGWLWCDGRTTWGVATVFGWKILDDARRRDNQAKARPGREPKP